MAITTLNGLIAGATAPEDVVKSIGAFEGAGIWGSLAYAQGRPGLAAAPASGLAGAALTAYPGQIPFTNPAAGQATYLTRLTVAANGSGTFRVYDRLWHNSGLVVTTTTAQTVSSVAWPARDRVGSTSGAGVLVGIEVSTATTNASAVTNTTMNYTNSAGVAGRTATMASFPATAVAGTFVPFQLQAGDTGVRSVQDVTLGTSYVTGAIHLVAYRALMQLGVMTTNVASELNAVTGGMPQLHDNSVPFLMWLPTSASGLTLTATVSFAQG